MLTNKTGQAFAKLLSNPNCKLKEIGLQWNKLTAKAGNEIAAALLENKELKMLDLSWNSIGPRPLKAPKKIMKKLQVKKFEAEGFNGRLWGEALRRNTTLVHLDMSYTKFEQIDTEYLSAGLDHNHTLVGFHFQGNFGVFDQLHGKVDSLGFLRMIDAYESTLDEIHIPIVPTDGSPTKDIQKTHLRNVLKDKNERVSEHAKKFLRLDS